MGEGGCGGGSSFQAPPRPKRGLGKDWRGLPPGAGGAGSAGAQGWFCTAETGPGLPLASGFASTDGGGRAAVPARQRRVLGVRSIFLQLR